MDVGLLSEKERASAGAMTASIWGGGTGSAAPVWKRRGSHPSSVEEMGAKRCGRGRRGVGVEETGPSHQGIVGSGAKGSDPMISLRKFELNPTLCVGSGAGAGGASAGGAQI
jgi:hypothetical protein